MDNFITWEFLLTWAGCTAATALTVQFLKKHIKLDPQIIAFVISVVLLELSTFFVAGLTLNSAILNIVNGLLCSLSSNGAYKAVSRLMEEINTEYKGGD